MILLINIKKINELKKHNNLYFNKDRPKISDSQYDQLKKEIILLEKKFPYLKNEDSIEKIVGFKPANKFKKINHLRPMLSLSNVFDKVGMQEFQKKICNFLNFKSQDIELFSEPKIDGISATLIYEDGLLTKGLSRGDGLVGEDILENLKTISNIPKKISSKNIPKILEIRCEIYIGKKDFENLKDNFANPRHLSNRFIEAKKFIRDS